MKNASVALVVATISTLLLSACTTRQIYGSLQVISRDNCNKLPETERSACLNRSQQGDYDTYVRKRNEVVNGPNAD